MSFEHWFAFVAASALLLAIPGPTILLVISYAISHGRKAAGATVAGVALGDFTAMTASMLGLGALLAASATIFTVLKWIGAAYLIWLGFKLWKAPVAGSGEMGNEAPAAERPLRIFLHAYAVTALNPKSMSFLSPSCRNSWICRGPFLARWRSSKQHSLPSQPRTRCSTHRLPRPPEIRFANPMSAGS